MSCRSWETSLWSRGEDTSVDHRYRHLDQAAWRKTLGIAVGIVGRRHLNLAYRQGYERGARRTRLSRRAQDRTGGGHSGLAHTRRAQVGVESARGLPFHVHDPDDARIAGRCVPTEPGVEHDVDGGADMGSHGAGFGLSGDHHIGADDHTAGREDWSRRGGDAR